jgi:hypothetical protein
MLLARGGDRALPRAFQMPVSSTSERLPLVPTLLCLVGASWVSGAVVAVWIASPGFATGAASTEITLASAAASAVVGAFALRSLLRSVVGFDVSYAAAVVALAAGSLLTAALRIALAATRSPHTPVAPFWSLSISLAGALAGAALTYGLLERSARPAAPVRTAAQSSDALAAQLIAADEAAGAHPVADDAPAPADAYERAARAACEQALALVARVSTTDPAELPGVLLEAMPALEATVQRLSSTPVPESEHDAKAALVGALGRLLDELVDLSQRGISATPSVYSRGLVLGSEQDVSDHGARNAFELSGSEAVAAIRETRRRLDS